MQKKIIYSFDDINSTGIDQVPINSIISITDYDGRSRTVTLKDKTNITSLTTINELLTIYGQQYQNTNVGHFINESVSISYDDSALNAVSHYGYTGHNNVGIGTNAGHDINSGYQSIFIGTNAGANMQDGIYNVMIGSSAGQYCQAGSNNIFLGHYSGRGYTDNTASNNICFGEEAGQNISTGHTNLFIGKESAGEVTGAPVSGYQNICQGVRTGYYLSNGSNNIFIGANAAQGDSVARLSGSNNISLGIYSSATLSEGDHNIVMGSYSCRNLSTGHYNVILGHYAAYGNATDHVTGYYNVALGYYSGHSLTSGGSNICIGIEAGADLTTGSNNILLGPQSGSDLIAEQHQIRIGVGTTSLIQGDTSSSDLVINGDLNLNNNALISQDSDGWNSDHTGLNIDHIWHDDLNNAWNLCSDTTYKAQGNTNLNIGNILIDGGDNTTADIISNDNGKSILRIMGESQGTGQLFVGQGITYGGGIEYNGDNSPSTTGAGGDFITLYRVNNGVWEWTARNYYGSNDWEFRGTVTENSDIKLKENLEVIPDAINKINTLSGYTYNMKVTPDERRTGVLAQEVQEVLPEAVTSSRDDSDDGDDGVVLSVAYGNMVGLLIEGIKEQQVQIDELKLEIQGLKA